MEGDPWLKCLKAELVPAKQLEQAESVVKECPYFLAMDFIVP
jgi:hypothetical protein